MLGSPPSVDGSVSLAGSVPLVGSDMLAGDSDRGPTTHEKSMYAVYFMRVLLISDNTSPEGTIQGWVQLTSGNFGVHFDHMCGIDCEHMTTVQYIANDKYSHDSLN